VRGRIDWKYALGLELSDSGFDHTVLTGFRQRLIDHGLEEKVLELLLARLSEVPLDAVFAGSGRVVMSGYDVVCRFGCPPPSTHGAHKNLSKGDHRERRRGRT
jgi:hypothetical protein